MAKDITLMGASYPDVPGVELPRTGGGTALFVDPVEIIDDNAGSGDTDKVWSADKSYSENSALLSAISSKYEKPQTGIPASDLASGVIPSVPVQDVQSGGSSIVSNGVAEINPVVTVSGTTPSITGTANTRYVCGEVATLSITAPASGCIDVVFQSGSTATVLTVSSAKSGVTAIKWANSFDPTSLDANTTYELNILDGEWGVAGSWT